MTDHDLKLMKQIWAIMIEYGSIVNPEFIWSYYGSHYRSEDNYDWRKAEKLKSDFISKLQIGVNWNKTSIPEYEQQAAFVGTGCESEQIETWKGYIVLNNGERFALAVYNVNLSPLIDQLTKNEEDLVAKYFGG